jgi:RNA polymerase sigma-70 factor (ECF subfamily)
MTVWFRSDGIGAHTDPLFSTFAARIRAIVARVTNGDDLIESMYDDGVRTWPRVRVELSTFRAHCVRVLANEPDGEARFHGADLYLCCACAGLDRSAMDIMEQQGAQVARTAIARVSRDAEFVQETLQELWEQLLFSPSPKVERYSGRGPLHAWLRVVASRIALDRCRVHRLNAEREVELAEHLAAESSDPLLRIIRSRYGHAFQEALQRALSELSSTDRNLLRLHMQRCSIDQIGRMYGVHRATAARWLDRAKRRVLDGARHRLATSSAFVPDGEFSSIAWDVQSELELHLSQVSEDATSSSGYLN